jgi:hypothetical protein
MAHFRKRSIQLRPAFLLPLGRVALPVHRSVPVPADQQVSIGETADFIFVPRAPGELTFEVRAGNERLVAAQSIRVAPAPLAREP